MKIAIGADHRAGQMVRHIIETLGSQGHEMLPLGVLEEGCTICDYPDLAYPVARAVADGQAERGILLCGSGIGMSIAANKVAGVRAALVHDEFGARLCRQHNNANVLCLSADMLGRGIIDQILEVWIQSDFEGGRHARRVDKITAIEQGKVLEHGS